METIETSSGNIFADLDLPDADNLLIKSDQIRAIRHAIKDRGLTQTAAAELLGIGQPDLSRLLKGPSDRYSIEMLNRLLRRLGHKVEVVISVDVHKAA